MNSITLSLNVSHSLLTTRYSTMPLLQLFETLKFCNKFIIKKKIFTASRIWCYWKWKLRYRFDNIIKSFKRYYRNKRSMFTRYYRQFPINQSNSFVGWMGKRNKKFKVNFVLSFFYFILKSKLWILLKKLNH